MKTEHSIQIIHGDLVTTKSLTKEKLVAFVKLGPDRLNWLEGWCGTRDIDEWIISSSDPNWDGIRQKFTKEV